MGLISENTFHISPGIIIENRRYALSKMLQRERALESGARKDAYRDQV